MAYVLERQSDFPGVEPEREFLRKYPHGTVGAHLFGQVGEVTEKQLKDQRYNGVEMGDRVGQAGHRARVRPLPARRATGPRKVEVDALGNLTDTLRRKRAEAGPASCACRSTSTSSAWPSRLWPAAPARAPSL